MPVSVWKSKITTFLDLEIGGGQFVREIERRLLTYGHSYANINKRVYGCGLWVKGAINTYGLYGSYSNKNLFKMKSDVLEGRLPKGWPMKFDVILSNPPFSDVNKKTSGA